MTLLVRCALLALLATCLGPARAQELRSVLVFSAPQQARLLLVLDGAPAQLEVQTRASEALPGVPARAVLLLPGLRPGSELPARIRHDADGLVQVLASPLEDPNGPALQLTVELQQARSIQVERVHERGLLVDLRGADAPATSEGLLPGQKELLAWLRGEARTAPTATTARRPLVVLDAGHGGWDHGVVGINGTREADIALRLARLTSWELRERLPVDVLLTRERDEFIGLTRRARIANEAGADLFVSIHANSAPGPAAWGIETYSMDTASDEGAARVAARENAIAREEGLSEEDDRLAATLITEGTMRLSRELSAHVQEGVCRYLQDLYGPGVVRNLGSKTALFTVLTRTRMPAVLFESSFLSHPVEERRLRSPHYQEAIAEGLVEAIEAFLRRQGQLPERSAP